MVSGRRRIVPLNPDGQFDNEPGSFGLVVLNANKPIMIRDNRIDDGKTQTGSLFLRGEIGFKKP
jgi:hypothetical protein